MEVAGRIMVSFKIYEHWQAEERYPGPHTKYSMYKLLYMLQDSHTRRNIILV